MDTESEYKHLFPVPVEVEQGKIYYWCSCGESQNPLFCDREGCGDKAVVYQATLSEELYFCNCKQTKNPPFCDGAHAKLLLEIVKKRNSKN